MSQIKINESMKSCVMPDGRECWITKSAMYTNSDDADPMSKFMIDSCDVLRGVEERVLCPKCKRSRRFFCYTCYIPMTSIESALPRVRLPIKLDIIKHVKEVEGKSTSSHAAILAPDDVRIFIYPQIPDWSNEKVILVFPSPNAKSLSDLCRNVSSTTASPNDDSIDYSFNKVVLIDSTWRQTKKIYKDARMKDLQCVFLSTHKSLFWRHQIEKPDTYLATIEAIYYFYRELHTLTHNNHYDGRFDNLLFFFKHVYNTIKDRYK